MSIKLDGRDRRLEFLVAALSLCACIGGCENLTKSRYAMDDPVYAEKYADGAPKTDVLGKLKQCIDARHVKDLSGTYLSAGVRSHSKSSVAAGAELGSEYYMTSWSSTRLGLAGYLGPDDAYTGVEGAIRFYTPTRLAPSIGVGTFHGVSVSRQVVDRDGEDNDGDGSIDELGEKDWVFDGALHSIYPEVGLHLWCNGRVRFSGTARYFVTSDGRAGDEWLYGGQLTVFSR